MKQPRPVSSEDKATLDSATPYTTFLPAMDEGFHMGYQATPGILSDESQKPGEWLENFAKYIRTQGEDVGYSIPDVLASEQQLRRLSRLPYDMAMRHQEMLDYRAVLTLLLLWDLLAADEDGAVLTLDDALASGESGGFSQAVRSALAPERAREGLQVFSLCHPRSEDPEKTPLCLLSRAMVLMPAANLADLSQLLPPGVQWYDRERKRFVDPCPFLDERMRSVLVPRLRLLQALNEDAAAASPIYSPEAHLCALIGRLITDVLAQRELWRERLLQGDADAEEALRVRTLAVYCLGKRDSQLRLTVRSLPPASYENNPLLRRLIPKGKEPPAFPAGEDVALYSFNGKPFARRSASFLLEPTEAPEEEETLEQLRKEMDLLDNYDEDWRNETGNALLALSVRLSSRTGMNRRIPPLLRRWARKYAQAPSRSDWDAVIRYPEDAEVQTLSPLIVKMMGAEAEVCVRKPFSDCLLLFDGSENMAMGSLEPSSCRVGNADSALCFVPPLSPEMAAWLEKQGEGNDPAAPRLIPGSLFCTLTDDGTALETGFCVACRVRDGERDAPGKVSFLRTSPLRTLPESGGAFRLASASLPCVTLWPDVRLTAGRWRQYFVHTHRPEAVDVWVLASSGWVQGRTYTAHENAEARPAAERSWRTVCTDRFPAYAVLKRGALSLGALVNDSPMRMLRREDAAVVGLDFGSIATTVVLRRGEKVQPAVLPGGLHGALFAADPEDARYLTDEFLPPEALAKTSTYYSVMDMFTDDPERWQNVLQDGHIYYPASLTALLTKEESALYYDLKWSEEDYVLRCLRLFLKQAMVQAALSARLGGSASVSWRVSMPNALPPHRQEAYLALVRGLAHEISEECGLPLTPNCPPVLYAAENQADGLYFRGRNEVNARNGYLNLDLGGGTADVSLWLNNAVHATAECSLLMGCRHILYASLSNGHGADFEDDFGAGDTPVAQAAREIALRLRDDSIATRGQQKDMLLMDDFFAVYAQEVRDAMAAARAGGRITYTEGLLLFNVGFLFQLCGALLQRAYQEAELRPLLPERLELCIAGNGGQLLKAFSQEQLRSLCGLALQALCPEHPVRALLPVQSADPKREVALGLLSDDGGLQSALQDVERWNGTLRQPPGMTTGEWAKPVTDYLTRFCRAFPLAASRVLRGVCETDAVRGEPQLTAEAQMELHTILENERAAARGDDMTAYVRCFAALKRLWRI